jgi:uncharacterized protein (TIGR00730 family)
VEGGAVIDLGTVCVYSGSNPGARPEFREAAVALGRELASRRTHVVYGGGHVGLMGAMATAALEAGGRVTGVIPKALFDKELGHEGLTELRVVDTMHERKLLMADLADAFVALPGGFGTFEELLEALTWTQLGVHEKPCGVVNVAGYFDHFLAMLDTAVRERFLRSEHRELVAVSSEPAELLDRLAAFRPVTVQKWLDRSGL